MSLKLSVYPFMPTKFKVRLKVFLTLIFLCTQMLHAQTAKDGMQSIPYRLNGEFPKVSISKPEKEFLPPSTFTNHPEFGTLPYNSPCTNCFEQIEKRTETSRYFIERGTQGKKFYEQTSLGPLHVKNKDGFWVSVTSVLNPVSESKFEAINQPFPLVVDLANGNCSMQNGLSSFTWNKNLHLIHKLPGGSVTDLGLANLSTFTCGADGVYISNAWPGIDIQILSLLGSVHTDYILTKDPGAGEFIFRDYFEFSTGLSISSPSGKFSSGFDILDADGQAIFNYDRAFVRDADPKAHGLHYLDYQTGINYTDLFFNRDDALAQGLQFPMTIDPLVTATNTLPLGSITGSGYNAFCFAGGCAYGLTVNSPANAVLTDILFSFNYIAQGACWMSDGAITFNYNGCQSPNIPGFFWFCNNNAGGVCTGANISLWSDLQPCVPASQCASFPMNFSMRFYRCFSAGGGCSNTCIGANSPWSVTVQGQTVTVSSASASNANICEGASTNLTANGNWGIPPYNVTWNPGALVGSPVSVSPTVTTLYTATITDACGQTATQNVNVNVTPSTNPGFTISPNPACENDPVTITGLGFGAATAYDWLTPGASTAATNNQQTIAGITYATAGNYAVTLNYTQGACVFPLVNNITINQAPATPVFTSNAPVCQGDQLTFDGPTIAGAVYQWSGPNGFVSALEDPVINNAQVMASGVYSLIVTVNGCSSTAATLNVTVNAPPALPIIGSNSPVCEGSSLNLTTATVPGATYAWTGPNGFISALEDPAVPNAQVVMSGVYSLIVSISGCSSAQANANVTISASPTANAGNNGPYCTASTIQFSSSGGSTYSWTGPSAFSSNLQNPSINNCTMANAGLYTVTVTDANGCTATASTNVSINNTLVFVIGSNSPVCEGDNLTFNAPAPAGAVYAWTGPSAFVSAIQNPAINSVTSSASGTYTLSITDANGCTGSATTQVTVNSLPVANASNTGPYCPGDAIQLNAGGGTSYSWTGPGAYSSAVQNPTIATATAAMAGNYTVTVTDANSCSATAVTSVVINAAPVANSSNTGPYCAGDAIDLTSGGGINYSWTGPNAYSSNLQNPNIPNSTAAMSGIYTVIVTDANGCTDVATTNVTVHALPLANAGNAGPYCDGDAIGLSVNMGTSFSWTGPNGFSSVLQNPVIASAGIAASGIYTVTVTDANGCSDDFTTTIVVNALPTITASNAGPYCPGNNMQLNAGGGSTYAWTGPLGFGSPFQNPMLNNATLAMNGVYTVIGTDVNGCTAQATTNLVVTANLVVVAGYSGVVCEGQSINLTCTAIPGATYGWNGPAAFLSNVQNPTINGITAAQSGQYDVYVTNANGCTGTSSVMVTVNPLPFAQASSSSPVCELAMLQLNALGGTGYTWSGPNGYGSNMQNPTIGSSALSDAGIYQVVVTDANGCTASANTNVIINPSPVIAVTQNGPLCEGEALQLSAGSGGLIYSWNGPGGFNANTVNPLVTNILSSGSGIYSVTATNASGCSATASTQVIVNPLPVPSFAVDQALGCSPLCVQFNSTASASTVPIISYEWRSNGISFNTGSDPFYCFVPVGNYEIALTLTDANGCVGTATITDFITVEDWPDASFTVPSDVVPVSDPVVQVTNTSTNATVYSWDFGDDTNSDEEHPLHEFPAEGKYCITLTVQSATTCTSNYTHCIEVESDFVVFIPNSFSPNGDSYNDYFHVKGSGIEELTMQIFNRWGQTVYLGEGEECYWDGYAGGAPAPQGVYMYSLRIRSGSGKVAEYYGDLTLVK